MVLLSINPVIFLSMKSNILLSLCLLISLTLVSQTVPQASTGTIRHFEQFPSKYVDARNVDVWLPQNYNPKKKYAVLYMHDGQMVFDKTITWNHTAWEVDEVFGKLMDEKKIRDCIVVGVWNVDGKRSADYYPQKVLDLMPEPTRSEVLEMVGNPPCADNYLKFLVTELKPFIDKNFSTHRNPKNTFVMGSSLGGLISAYALCEYPNIFGGAGCLSIHTPMIDLDKLNANIPAEDNPGALAFREYLMKNLPKTNTRKFYFDYGNKTIDVYYAPYQQRVDEVMKKKGYNKKHCMTRFYEGDDHSEIAWSRRLHIPAVFLLGN